MRNNTTVALTLWSMLALAGCATTNDVLFVTKTSLGIDFDSKPASASIAYDRTEGYIAPRYDNGEIPHVVASIKSDAKIFNPKISQVYATGDAAVIAVSKEPQNTLKALDPKTSEGKPEKKLKGEKKLMFFGTTTTTGLKVGFTTYVPDSFLFGFRRKEYSFIPLGTVGTGDEAYDVYPSVLASIDTAANAGTADETGAPSGDTSLSNSQYFATGRAARELAANDAVSKAFKEQAEEATASLRSEQGKRMKKQLEADKEREVLVKDINLRFNAADDARKEKIVKLANETLIKQNGGDLTVDNFEEKLEDFHEFNVAPGVDKVVVLKELKKEIDKK